MVWNGGFIAQPMVRQRGPKQPPLLNLSTSLHSAAFPQEVPTRLCGDGEIILGFICGGFEKANSKLCEMTLGDNNLQQMSRLFNVLSDERALRNNKRPHVLATQIVFRYYFSWISLSWYTTCLLCPEVIACSSLVKIRETNPNVMGKSPDCKTPQHKCIAPSMHTKSRSEKKFHIH